MFSYRMLYLLLGALALGACTMENPSFVKSNPMLVTNEDVVFSKPSRDVSKDMLLQLADDIKRRADGPVTLTIQHPAGAQALAIKQAQMIKSLFADNYVRSHVIVSYNANKPSPPNQIIVRYSAVRANADCAGTIMDADAGNYNHTSDNPYKLGCSRDQFLSAMIARPVDLLGNDATSTADSQRLGKSQETYRAGERATPSDATLSASDVYGQ